MNLLTYRMPLDQAVNAPRVHHGFVPDALRYETRYPPASGVLRQLSALGHTLTHPSSVIGDANNLIVVRGELIGYADPREGGLALGARDPAGAH
jgi:gamma-glutamyltranspeptidase / glutathione hydrolase